MSKVNVNFTQALNTDYLINNKCLMNIDLCETAVNSQSSPFSCQRSGFKSSSDDSSLQTVCFDYLLIVII